MTEWIKFIDRPPDVGDEVLVYCAGCMYIFTYLGNNVFEDMYGYWHDSNEFYYWTYKPEPPIGE